MLTPTAFIDAYDGIGQKKAGFSSAKILLLGILAGFLIGMGGVVTNTAGFALENPSVAKVVSGLLFPFGLAMVILTGAELFTGNCLLIMPKTAGKIMMNTWPGVSDPNNENQVIDWLKAYDGKTPISAHYQWVTYNPTR